MRTAVVFSQTGTQQHIFELLFRPEMQTIKSVINKTQRYESGGRSCGTNRNLTYGYNSTAKR
jgi:hypothetical protein